MVGQAEEGGRPDSRTSPKHGQATAADSRVPTLYRLETGSPDVCRSHTTRRGKNRPRSNIRPALMPGLASDERHRRPVYRISRREGLVSGRLNPSSEKTRERGGVRSRPLEKP